MRTNFPFHTPKQFTHEGAPATLHLTALQQLRRSVLSCLLWESEFYEDGETIAKRIVDLAGQVTTSQLAALAVEARNVHLLRHVPLVLLSCLAQREKGSSLVADTFPQVIKRADELAEFLSVHQKIMGTGKVKLTHGIRKGLAKAFARFDAYQLAKYNRDNAIKLRDVLRLVHPKPGDEERSNVYKMLNEGTLPSPDTWEVALSGGADKKETFERLIREGNLGYLALLRNLRNMLQAGCDLELVRSAILARRNGADKVLPFRFVAAARNAMQLEPELDKALCQGIELLPKLSGTTVVLVDVSGSMRDKLSGKSDLTRMDAAAALASIINGNCRVFSFSGNLVECSPRKGMAGIDSIIKSQRHSSTYLGQAVTLINQKVDYDRLIVITDEQSHDRVPDPKGKAYMINVASNKNGVGYGKWIHIDGFSESVVRYVYELENQKE